MEKITDPLVTVGEQLDIAIAEMNALEVAANYAAWVASVGRVGAITDTILGMKASSIAGAAVQVRALVQFHGAILGTARDGEDEMFVRVLYSIGDVLDQALGIERERWGGDYFLPQHASPFKKLDELIAVGAAKH